MTWRVRREAGISDDMWMGGQQPFNQSAAQDEIQQQQGISRQLGDRPGYEIAPYAPNWLADEGYQSTPVTPLEVAQGRALRASQAAEEDGALDKALRIGGALGRGLLESVNVAEKGITSRQRLFRFANIASFALPFGLGSRAIGAGIARVLPATSAVLKTAKGRVVLTSLAEAGIAGSIEAINDHEGSSVFASSVIGGVVGAGGAAIINKVAKGARLSESKAMRAAIRESSARLLQDFEDVPRLAADDSPFRVHEWAVLTPQDVATASRASNGDKGAIDFVTEQMVKVRGMLEGEGFLPQAVRLDDGRDALLVPGMRPMDAARVGRDLGMDRIHTRQGMLDLTQDLMYPARGDFRVGAQVDQAADTHFSLAVPDEAGQGSVVVSPRYNVDEPVTIGRGVKVDPAQRVLDGSVFEPSNFQRFAQLDSRVLLKRLYRSTINAMYGSSVLDSVVAASKKARGTAREVVAGEVVTVDEGLQKLVQLNASKWSGFIDVAVRSGVRSWDSLGQEGTKMTAPALLETLAKVPNADMEAFMHYGLLKRQADLVARGEQVHPTLKDVIPERLEALTARAGEDTVGHWDDVLQEVSIWQEAVLRETLVKQGIIGEEQLAKFIEANPVFLPLTRRAERPPRTVEELDDYLFEIKDPVKRAIGTEVSEADRWVPWPEEIIRRAGMYARMGAQQEVYTQLGRMLRKAPEALSKFATRVDGVPLGAKRAGLDVGLEIGQHRVVNSEGTFVRVFQEGEDVGRVTDGIEIQAGPTGKTQTDGTPLMGVRKADGTMVVDEEQVLARFPEKPWTKPKVEGVRALPEDAFQTPEEWLDFVRSHEAAHSRFRPEDLGAVNKDGNVIRANYENAINEIALKSVRGEDWRPTKWEVMRNAGFDEKAISKARESGQLPKAASNIQEAFDKAPSRVGGRQEEWWKLSTDLEEGQALLESLEFLGPQQTGAISRFMATFASLQRAGVVLGDAFMGKNVARDIAFAFASAGVHPTAFLRGSWEMLKSYTGNEAAADLVDRFVASGAARSALVSMDTSYFRRMIRDASARGMKNVVAKSLNPIDVLRALSETLENATRIGAFRQRVNQLTTEATRQGQVLDPKVLMSEAAIFAREGSVDFSVRGAHPVMASLRMMSAFFGAAVSGTDQFVKNIARDPVGVGWRMGVGITAPSVMLYLHNRKDPDYFQLPDYERDLFWHVKRSSLGPLGEALGEDPEDPSDDLWLRVPKPFEPGILAGSMVERFMQFVEEEDPQLLDDAAVGLFERMGEGYIPMPTVLQPAIDVGFNSHALTDRPIVPRVLEDVDPDFHGGSKLAQGLARMMNAGDEDPQDKVSPRQIDHFISSWTGSVGTTAVDVGDLVYDAARRVQGEELPPRPAQEWMEVAPFVRGFVSAFPSGNKAVEEAYDYAEKMRVAGRTVSYLEDNMRADDIADYVQEHTLQIGLGKLATRMERDLGKLRDARLATLQAPNMSPQEKRRVLHEIDRAMLSYTSTVNKAVKDLGLRARDPGNPASNMLRSLLAPGG